jgi:hypothetical protein
LDETSWLDVTIPLTEKRINLGHNWCSDNVTHAAASGKVRYESASTLSSQPMRKTPWNHQTNMTA